MEFTQETGRSERLHFLANEVVLHVPGAATGSAYCLAEFEGPRGDMPPLHVHHSVDETFYVLEGALSIFAGDEATELAVGDSLVAPYGTPHTYRVESDSARWLVICSPAGFHDFVREVAAAGSEAGPAELAAISSRYGIEILGPPGTLPMTV